MWGGIGVASLARDAAQVPISMLLRLWLALVGSRCPYAETLRC